MNTEKHHILMIDDDTELCRLVKTELEKDQFIVETRNEVDKGIYVLESSKIDLVLLDVVMPKIDGIEAAKSIRGKRPDMPVIFLTSQSDIHTKSEGFNAGADDYVIKPFLISELTMRIKAVLRRSNHEPLLDNGKHEYDIGKYRFLYGPRKLVSSGDERSLSIKEAELLKLLCDNQGKYIKRDSMLAHVWGKVDTYAANSMDVYISRVRKLFKEDGGIKIENLHGTGYRILIDQ